MSSLDAAVSLHKLQITVKHFKLRLIYWKGLCCFIMNCFRKFSLHFFFHLPLGFIRLPSAMGGQFQLFCWPTNVTSGVMVCAPSCPNWRTSPKSTDLSTGMKPLPRQDEIIFCFCLPISI